MSDARAEFERRRLDPFEQALVVCIKRAIELKRQRRLRDVEKAA